jgi:hypothetical protein
VDPVETIQKLNDNIEVLTQKQKKYEVEQANYKKKALEAKKAGN